MAKSARRIPPSRVKYEQANPTVSGRVTLEIYDRLRAMKEAEGKSFADVLKIGLGILEARARAEEEVREEGYSTGLDDGYLLAQDEFEVTYLCNVCCKPMAVTFSGEKEAIKQYMEEHGWGHGECINRRQ